MTTICTITGTRAEYGLLRNFVQAVQEHPRLTSQLLVTGAHLSTRHGNTVREIESDGLPIHLKVPILEESEGDDELSATRATGMAVTKIAEALHQLHPNVVALLGDRYETFAAATAATLLRIPIIHFHGGETTEGAFDEAFRHAITKMAHLHFAATEPYRQRIIQLGEHPSRVFNIGAMGLDSIACCQVVGKSELAADLQLEWQSQNVLVTFHPVTLEKGESEAQCRKLLAGLARFRELGILFTLPNADPENQVIRELTREFVADREHAWAFESLGQQRYLSALRVVDAVIGNSSSGIIEVPAFGIGTVNIGDRQRGRLAGPSVVHCEAKADSIRDAIALVLDPQFRQSLGSESNIYGTPGAAKRAVVVLEKLASDDWKSLLKKPFHDLP